MPLPSNAYYPLFPIQETIYDSTTGFPLAGGIVSFFQDQNRTIPKDVFQRTENPDNTFTYASLGSVLTLSSIGTFVDANGNNIIPFLWPYAGLPQNIPPSIDVQLYYIIVTSIGATPEFTVSAWPPQVAGGSSGGDTIISSNNIVSNPQFAVINYPSPYTFNFTTNSTTQIAPDWNIITTGTGSVTISQIPVTDPDAPGVPAFALEISSTGISTLILSQTISMSPRILENGYASGTFIVEAVTAGTGFIMMGFVPSNPAMPVIPITSGVALTGGYTEYSDTVNLAAYPTNTDPGSTGYVNIQLDIPVGNTIRLSCIQLVSVPDVLTIPSYIQESTPRQIDHLYHDAYPIVPVGTIIDFAGYPAPLHYLLCDGTNTYSRQTYNQLFRAITLQSVVTLNSTNTYTDTNAPLLYVGMYLEGTGIPANTTISSITANTIVISNAATVTASSTLTYFPWGAGDNTSDFAVPNLNGQVLAGSGSNLFAISPLVDVVGQNGGSPTHTMLIGEMPLHNHPGSVVNPMSTSTTVSPPGSNAGAQLLAGTWPVAVAQQGGGILNTQGTPFNIVQPTTIVYKYIRFE
jgi:microcystin-dependent protein